MILSKIHNVKKGNLISGEDVKAAQHRINIIIHKGIMSFQHPLSNTYSESFQQKTNAMLVPAHFMAQRLPHETMISNVAKTISSGYDHSVNEKKRKFLLRESMSAIIIQEERQIFTTEFRCKIINKKNSADRI